MNYKDSKIVKDALKKANKIVINCHRSPDPDSVGSALSIFHILKSMGKKNVSIICPDKIPDNCLFLAGSGQIKVVEFDRFDFSSYDLFIVPDCGGWSQITGEENILNSGIKKIIIDHHLTNSRYGDINIVDIKAGSTCAVIYKLIQDLNVDIDRRLAESLFTGIVSDTLSFQTEVIGDKSFLIANDLINLGADRVKILFNLNMSKSLDDMYLMGYLLSNIKIDSDFCFAWTCVPINISKQFTKSNEAKAYIAGSFIQSIVGTDFGFVVEEKEDYCSVSLRSRNKFDVSKIAADLGGGGHKAASGARVNLPLDEAIEKILSVCRKYANTNKK